MTSIELHRYLEGLAEPHVMLDQHYTVVAANAAYRREFGGNQPLVGRKCYEVSHHFTAPCDQSGETCPLAAARRSGQTERVLHLHHTPKGEAYVSIELSPIEGDPHTPIHFVEKMQTLPVANSTAHAQGLIGRSPPFQHMLALVSRVAPSQASVLLLGESGTGKELLAHAIHSASPRAQKPLVPVDCSSLTESLFESELFGHERGAFTGAHSVKAGLVQAAHGGTLFLDELGDIPLSMQVKLLRLLETGTYRRVGGTEQRHADIRIISATHRNLGHLLAQGRFREDLYFRLSTFPIHLPALRERREDIALLAEALLQRIAPERALSISAAALPLLLNYPFPGNVRELRNLLERASLMCDGSQLTARHLQQAIAAGQLLTRAGDSYWAQQATHAPDKSTGPALLPPAPTPALKDLERQAFTTIFQSFQGSRAELAAELGISPRSLYRKMKDYKL